MTTPTHIDFSGDLAAAYEEHFVPIIPAPLADRTIRRAELQPGEHVLDVACGTGIVARLAAERLGPGAAVTGVDVSPDMLAHARALSTASGVHIDWREGDAAKLPIDDDSFDVAVCQMGLQFVGDKPAAAAELRRVLRPGGRVVISVAGSIQPLNEAFAEALSTHVDPALGGFMAVVFSMHDPVALADLFTDNGFRDVDARVETLTLRLPSPTDYLWGYVSATPLSLFMADTPLEVRKALEADLTERWQPFVDGDGMTYDQPIVWATAQV